MATIQQLLRSSKPGRVQVADLAQAPNLQPTISAGGRYTVQVQQAGKNKWNDLADALSQVNPALREFTAAQKLEAEIFANEQLQRKPEEVLADLKKQAEPFNKMTRKGGLPLIGNPFAVMQNKRTMGQIAARAFRIDLENELDVAPADETPEQTYQRVRQQFEQDHPRLVDENGRPALGTGDGFQAELNEYLPAVLRSSEKLRNEKAKAESRVVAAEGLASTFKQEGMSVKTMAAWAADTAHMTPAEQRAVITSVANSLVRGGDNPQLAYDEAMAFVTESTKLPIGNAKLGSKLKGKDDGERVFGEFSTYISDLKAGLEDIMERRKRGQDDEDDKIAESVAGPIYDYIQTWKKTIEGAPTSAEKQALVEKLFTEFAETSETHKRIVPTIIRQSVQTLVDMPKDEFFPNWYKFNNVNNPITQLARTHKQLEDANTPEFGTGVDLSELQNNQIEQLKIDRAKIIESMSNPDGYTLQMPEGYDNIVREGKQTDEQKTQDILAWDNARLDSSRKELQQAYTDRLKAESVLQKQTATIDPEDRKSYIAGDGQTVGDVDTLTVPSAFNVEKYIYEQNGPKAKNEAEQILENEDTVFMQKVQGQKLSKIEVIMDAVYGTKTSDETWWDNRINNASTQTKRDMAIRGKREWVKRVQSELLTPEDARKRLLVLLMGSGKLNESAILEGKLTFKWGRKGRNEETFKIEDMEAVGTFAQSYPVISTDAVQTFKQAYTKWGEGLKEGQDAPLPNTFPFTTYKEVFKKLYNVSTVTDEDLLTFMESQYQLHISFKNITK